VVDVFIPFKRSKVGKRFAFVRLIKVANIDRLVENLCTIWIGRLRRHENIVRFQRSQRPFDIQPKKTYVETSNTSFVSIIKEVIPKNFSLPQSKPALVLDDLRLLECDFRKDLIRKIRAKDIDTWEPNFDEQNSDCTSEDERFVEDKGHTIGELDGRHHGEQDGEHHKTKKWWIKELCSKNRINFVALKETKIEHIDPISIKGLWGNYYFDFAASHSVENSGGLIDLSLGGYSFTWTHKLATKMSKLDRFIVSEGLMALFPHLSALFPDRHSSDQRLILMRDMILDYPLLRFGYCILGLK
nr:RNA-directed DNA polymerase, eukaryota, nucleotide-binding alpha-beta plait domain protein [Tanacetum cinerariifolium]